jgi:hypothetical protein
LAVSVLNIANAMMPMIAATAAANHGHSFGRVRVCEPSGNDQHFRWW